MKHLYPKIVFKTREDSLTVASPEAEEKAIEEGYGDYDVVILGREPREEGVVQAPSEDAEEARMQITKEVTAKLNADYETAMKAQAEDHEKTLANLNEKLEASENNLVESNKALAELHKELEELKKPATA